jgi:hypothetical protein
MSTEPVADADADAARPSLSACVRSDLADSTWRQRALLLATVGWIAYEWGFGNEALTPWVLVRVVSATSGWWSVVATAAAGFAFTATQQFVSGHTAAAGFAMFRRTADALWRLLRRRLDDEPRDWFRQSWAMRSLVVFTLGTTAVVLIQMTTTGQAGSRRLRAVVNQGAVLCGAGVGLIGAVVAAAVWVGRSVPALESSTDWLLRILGNPLFWIGLLVVVMAGRRLVGGRPVSRP